MKTFVLRYLVVAQYIYDAPHDGRRHEIGKEVFQSLPVPVHYSRIT